MSDASLHTFLWWPVATWINCFCSWWWLLAVIIIICIYKNTFHLRISKCFCTHLIKLHNILWGKCQEHSYIHFYTGFPKKTRSVSTTVGVWVTSHLHWVEQEPEVPNLVTVHIPHHCMTTAYTGRAAEAQISGLRGPAPFPGEFSYRKVLRGKTNQHILHKTTRAAMISVFPHFLPWSLSLSLQSALSDTWLLQLKARNQLRGMWSCPLEDSHLS